MFKNFIEGIKKVGATLLSTIAEKDPDKAKVLDIRFSLSATRMSIIAGVVMFWVVISANPDLLSKWPPATFGIFIHTALSITWALKRVNPDKIIEYAQSIADRLGKG